MEAVLAHVPPSPHHRQMKQRESGGLALESDQLLDHVPEVIGVLLTPRPGVGPDEILDLAEVVRDADLLEVIVVPLRGTGELVAPAVVIELLEVVDLHDAVDPTDREVGPVEHHVIALNQTDRRTEAVGQLDRTEAVDEPEDDSIDIDLDFGSQLVSLVNLELDAHVPPLSIGVVAGCLPRLSKKLRYEIYYSKFK